MTRGQASPVLRYLRQFAGLPTAGAADAQLIERFVSRRDEAAFAALVQRHGPMVFGLCRRVLHNVQDAEDAFQATFLILARKAGSIHQRKALGPWLYGVAYRTALKARARSARRRQAETPLIDLPVLEPLSELAWRELRLVLDEEIGRLPARYRASVVLCYLERLTYAEAARQLGCPPGTVSGRLARARELLRLRLVRRGFTLSAGLLGGLLSAEAAPAAVPPVLIRSTVMAATAAVTHPAAAGALPARIVALAEGANQAMMLTRLKIATALVLVAGLVGVSGVAYQSRAEAPRGPAAPPEDKQSKNKKVFEEARRAMIERTEQLKRHLQRIEGLKKIQQGLNLLKKNTENNQGDKTAVDEFEKAFRKLEERFGSRSDKPRGSGRSGKPDTGQAEGVVQAVSPEGLVRITLGSDAGIQRGQNLEVYRLNPPTYLGRLLILEVAPQGSVGRVVRPLPAKPIKPNDRVTPSLRER